MGTGLQARGMQNAGRGGGGCPSLSPLPNITQLPGTLGCCPRALLLTPLPSHLYTFPTLHNQNLSGLVSGGGGIFNLYGA